MITFVSLFLPVACPLFLMIVRIACPTWKENMYIFNFQYNFHFYGILVFKHYMEKLQGLKEKSVKPFFKYCMFDFYYVQYG